MERLHEKVTEPQLNMRASSLKFRCFCCCRCGDHFYSRKIALYNWTQTSDIIVIAIFAILILEVRQKCSFNFFFFFLSGKTSRWSWMSGQCQPLVPPCPCRQVHPGDMIGALMTFLTSTLITCQKSAPMWHGWKVHPWDLIETLYAWPPWWWYLNISTGYYPGWVG